MRRVTYKPGQFSQVLLPDGTRLFVHTRPTGIKIRRMLLGPFLPGRTVWEFPLPLLIRRVGPASDLGSPMLELVLESLEPCRTLPEAIARLKDHAAPALTLMLDKYLERVRTALEAGDDAQIIRDCGAALEQLGTEGGLLIPLSRLPHRKERIDKALANAIASARSQKEAEQLRVVRIFLDNFVPDDEVPRDPLENAIAWARRHGRE